MKLTTNISLDAKRAAALTLIDETYARRLTPRAAMTEVYALKEALAERVLHAQASPPEWLTLEAESKGVTVLALCQQILDKATEAREQAALLEELRQRAKAQVRLAQSEQAIDRAVQSSGG